MIEEKYSNKKLSLSQSANELLVIIDGNHLIHRAFYAIQAPLKTSRGEQTNAIYGFFGMLINIIEREKPNYITLTFDERAPTFRHEAYEGYKATRTKAPDELYAQIPRIREMVKGFKIPIFAQEGYEADDMMGTLAVKAEAEGMISYIVTGDMDALQLITPNIFVAFPHKGYRAPIIYDDQKVFEKYGIYPNQVVDYKALVGDASDNIKGVDGIGPKRATELLSKYQTLDNIYKHLSDTPESIQKKLEADREQAFFAQSLAKIVTDVSCDFNKEQAGFNNLDFQALSGFFEELEINSLQRRLNKIMPTESKMSEDQMSLF